MPSETSKELAVRLLDYPEHQWENLVGEWCADDKSMRLEVLRIAAENRNARDFVEDLQNRISLLTKETLLSGMPIPDRIAGYKVLKKIGDGGSSTVYLVEANGGNAALKLLRRGFEGSILLQQTGELEEADNLFREAVDVIYTVWGKRHPYMAFILNGYSGLHQLRGLYDLAEADLHTALEIGREVFPDTHPFIAVALHNLGKLYAETGDYNEAISHYRDSLKLRRGSLPSGHPDIASSLDGLAMVLIQTDLAAEAEPLLREALEIRQNAFDEKDWRVAQVEAHLGRSLLRQGKIREAEPLLIKSHRSLQASRGDHDPHTLGALEDINSLRSAVAPAFAY